MSMKRLVVTALLAGCSMLPEARAQKNELAGLIGRTFISDQTITGSTASDSQLRFGNGLTFEANYGRRVMNLLLLSVTLEVPVILNPDEDLHAALPSRIPESYRSFFVTPAGRFNLFPDLGVSPWASVGGGFGHFTASSNLLFGGNNPGPTGSTTGVFQFGGGLDVKLMPHFKLRAEARDFLSGAPPANVSTGNSHQHNLFVAGGLMWQF
jgi:hypothetical protein